VQFLGEMFMCAAIQSRSAGDAFAARSFLAAIV